MNLKTARKSHLRQSATPLEIAQVPHDPSEELKMEPLLIVEDSPETVLLLKKALGKGTEIVVATTSAEALAALAERKFSLVILDMSLPDGDGLQLFTEMRGQEELQDIPVMFLSGDDQVTTKVTAFSMGADDYIVKPFNLMELKARVEAKLKKSSAKKQNTHLLNRGQLRLDSSTQRVHSLIEAAPTVIHLTPREFKILFQLARAEEVILSRESIMSSVWGDSSQVFDRAVDTHISSIRKKLGVLGKYIESIPGSGYRFSSAGKTSALDPKSKRDAA